MDAIKWFDRKFNFSAGPDAYAAVYRRLQQGPESLQRLLDTLSEEVLIAKPDGKWSVKEHAGHLSVLEPIWQIRFHDIRDSKPVLTPADLDNRATTEAGFNHYSVLALVEKFAAERMATLSFLDSIDARDESRTSLHPRLQQPMRIIDLAVFVAEHDDHHFAAIREVANR